MCSTKTLKDNILRKKIEFHSFKYYVEILIQKGDLRFIYVDILAKQLTETSPIYNDKKEVLFIRCNKQFKHYYIKQFIYDQLAKGNHKWGAKSPYKTLFTHAAIKHRQDLKSFVKKILKIMSK